MLYPVAKNVPCLVEEFQRAEELSAQNERLQKLALDLMIRVARLRSQADEHVEPNSIPGIQVLKRTRQSLH
jgi:hypothetical protein